MRPGTLLVATGGLLDPTFRRTVVLMLAHGQDGSLGVILNRRSETAVQQVLPGWQRVVSRPRAMYFGGPVEPGSALCVGVRRAGTSLGSAADPTDITARLAGEVDALLDPVAPPLARVSGELVLVDLDADPIEVMPQLRGLRIFAGHAGWEPGQLDGELAENSWHTVDSLADDVLSSGTDDLYFSVLRRQRMPLALAAYTPLDPSLN